MASLKSNITANIIGQSLLAVIGLIATKLIYSKLGSDVLGVIYFAIMLNGIIAIIGNMGIQVTVIRQISAYQGVDDDYVKCLVQSASFILWFICILSGLIFYFYAPAIVSMWIKLENMNSDMAIYALRVIVISSFLIIPQSLYKALFDGMQRMHVRNFIEVASMLFQQAGVITILMYGGQITSVAKWIAANYCFVTAVFIVVSLSLIPWQALIPWPNFRVVRKNLIFSTKMAAISLLAMVHTHADRFFVSKFLPISMLGYYSVVYAILSKLPFFSMQIARAAFPKFCELNARCACRESLLKYNLLQELVCFGAIPLVAAIQYFCIDVIAFLFDAKVAGLLKPVIWMLSIAMFLQMSFVVIHYFVLAQGRVDIILRQSIINVVVSVLCSYLAVSYLGLNGVGLAFLLSRIFVIGYTLPIVCRECLGCSVLSWLNPLFLAVSSGMLSYGGLSVLIWLTEVQGDVWIISLFFCIATFLFLLISWRLISATLRLHIGAQIRKFINSLCALSC